MKSLRSSLRNKLLPCLLLIFCASCASMKQNGGLRYEKPVLKGPLTPIRCQAVPEVAGLDGPIPEQYTDCWIITDADLRTLLIHIGRTCEQAGFSKKECGTE